MARALQGCEGVTAVKVNFASKTATVTGDSQKMSNEKLVEALKKTDRFTGTIVE